MMFDINSLLNHIFRLTSTQLQAKENGHIFFISRNVQEGQQNALNISSVVNVRQFVKRSAVFY